MTTRQSMCSKAGMTNAAPKTNQRTSESRLPPSSASSTAASVSALTIAPKISPPTKAETERVPSGLRRHLERQERQSQCGQATRAVLHPVAAMAERQQAAADECNPGADEDADDQLLECAETRFVVVAGDAQ